MDANTFTKKQLVLTGILGSSAVGLGAMGAHYLKGQMVGGLITAEQLDGFDKAVKYQMFHTLAILILTVLQLNFESHYFKLAIRFFLWGIVLFSGSLYLLCTRQLWHAEWLKVLGPVTPLGGICFIIGWCCLIPAGRKGEKK
jgi:uncharacterized membrane protein YgdD (TMEM256/DUF423 family)